MKVRTHLVLSECIERGAARGWRMAHKHIENPTEEAVLEKIENAIMGEIYEWFSFDDDDRGFL